jgi:hypothetical protein
VKVNLPIIVRVDNVGAIFIGNNVTVSQRSKHIDIRYHFVRSMSRTVSFGLFSFGPRTTMQIFSRRTYRVICTVAMPPRLLERSKMAWVSVSGHRHMIGRVSEVHTTTTTHACGLAGIMCDAGMKMSQPPVREAYWYEDDGVCIRRVRVTTSVWMLARLQ